MEERKLNEKESLELIAQMIQNTKNRMETNCGERGRAGEPALEGDLFARHGRPDRRGQVPG